MTNHSVLANGHKREAISCLPRYSELIDQGCNSEAMLTAEGVTMNLINRLLIVGLLLPDLHYEPPYCCTAACFRFRALEAAPSSRSVGRLRTRARQRALPSLFDKHLAAPGERPASRGTQGRWQVRCQHAASIALVAKSRKPARSERDA